MSKPKLPDVHFGKVEAKPIDWRDIKELDREAPDDDAELPETPPDVTAMLGFDPKDLQ
jgi:hypothetical protein